MAARIIRRRKVEVATDQIEEEEDGDDYFEKLPDEILVIIFIKLLRNQTMNAFLALKDIKNVALKNVKLLAQCSIISKRFNAIVPLVISSLYLYKPTNLLQILQKFKNIETLHLRTRSKANAFNFKWKIVYGIQGYRIAALRYASVTECSNQDFHGGRNFFDFVRHGKPTLEEEVNLSQYYLGEMFRLHHKLLVAINKYKLNRLRGVVITDSEKQRNFNLGEKQIDEIRNTGMSTFELRGMKKICYIRSLHLPLSGVLMNKVSVVIMTFGESAYDYVNEVTDWHFEEEDKVTGEAFSLILGRYWGMFSNITRPEDFTFGTNC